MIKKQNKWWILAIILFVILAFLIGFRLGKKQENTANNSIVIRQIDTVFVNVADTLYVPKTKIRTVNSVEIDTVVITRAFEKSIDTTFDNSARVQITYYFPQDSFRIALWQYIKEIRTYDTIKVSFPVETFKTSDAFKWGAGGLLTGAIIGFIIAK